MSTISTIIIGIIIISFIASIVLYKIVGSPFNGLFIIISYLSLIAVLFVFSGDFNVSTPYIRIEKQIDTINTSQKQLKAVVEETIELIDLVYQLPSYATIAPDNADSLAREYQKRIELQKKVLKKIPELDSN
jgi:hypothetical protein